jgi:uncharacterized protein (TIGR02421 family)
MPATTTHDATSHEILELLRRHEPVRRSLSQGGVLHIDRDLPFLLVHRRPEDRPDAGTSRLVSGEAAYLLARAGEWAEVEALVPRIAEAGATAYGAFIVLEVWSGADPESHRFTLFAPDGPAPETVDRFEEALGGLRTLRPGIEMQVERSDRRHPPDLPPLLSVRESWEAGVLVLGLEIPPLYRDPETGDPFPPFLRELQHHLSRALRQGLYEFTRVQTTCRVRNPLALGTRTLPDAVWEVDRELVKMERTFSLLLLTSPANQGQAWQRFEASGFDRNPEFHYRLLPMDPALLKRRLFALEMERIDDPAIADLFQDKREELDTQLTMLWERDTPRFRPSSMRLYGTVDDELHALARSLLDEVQVPRRAADRQVDAHAFRDAAVAELAHYRERYPGLDRKVQIRTDLTGLMVSEGNLLIGETLMLDPSRVEALIHHEVGTHVLTYVNGAAQPLEQLSLGLADYDELQEGLAVLSEYLVGGLNALRMRLLAARVLAARSVEEGGEFVDTFRLLTREYGYTPGGAWHITTRVHTCGGFTRDFIYLRGLVELMEHLRGGGELEPLYVGKIARKHIPVIEELRHREVLHDPPLLPRFLDDPEARDRLAAVRDGISLTQMVSPENA